MGILIIKKKLRDGGHNKVHTLLIMAKCWLMNKERCSFKY